VAGAPPRAPAAGGAATGAHDGATPNAGASEVASAGTPEAKGSASEPQSVSPAGHEALADSSVGQPEALASASPAAAHGELAPERAGDGRERAGDGRERAGDGRERAGDDREGNPAERAGTEMGDAALGMADIGASRAGAEGAAEGARRRGASEEAGEPKGSGAGRETGSAEGGPDSEPAGKKGGRTSEADAESASAGAEQPGNGAAPEAAETAAPGRRNAAGAETSGEGAEPAARRASEGKADESGKAAEPKAKGDAVERLKQVDALVGRGRRAVGEMLSGVRAKLESSENPVARAVRFTAKVSMTTGAALERFGEKVDRKMDLVNVLLIKGWRKVFGGGPIEYDASGRRLVVKKDKNGVEHKEPVHPGIIANDIMELGRYLQGKLHSDGVRPPTTDEIWNAKPRPDAKAPPTEPGGGRPPGTPPRIEPVLMRRAIAEAHPDKDVPTSVGRRPVADSEAARKLRHEQRFVRRPGYPEEDVFVQNSTKANELFNRWLSGEEGSAGLRETMEAMHKLYAGDGEIGKGQGGQYAPDGAAVNKRALRVRQFVKDYYGLEANPDGAVHLPGIPVEMSPHFVANHYFYPDSKIPGMRDTYYKAMEAQVARYLDLVGKVDAMKAADPNYAADPRYQAAVKEALGAVADFGQIAAAFRQFRNGNWGLYGPMMNSMVNRMGLEIKYPGYLDLILQSATEASAKPFFVDAVLNGKSFFPADGYDPLTGKTVAPFQPVDLTVAAGVDPVLAGELGPRISARYERLAELKREYERELRGRNPSVEKLDAMREEYAGLRKLNVEDQTHLAAAQNASWNPGDPLTAKVFDMMAANMGARVETLSVVRDDSPNALKRLFSNEGIAPNRSQTTRDFDVSGTHLNEYGSGHVVSVAEKLNTGMAILSMGLDGANLRLKGIMLESAPVPGAKVPDIFLKYGGRPGEGALRQQEVLVTDIAEGSIAGARLRKIVNLDGSDVTEVKAGRYLFRYSDLIPLDHARLNSPERAAYIQEYQAAVDGAKLTHAMEFEIPADLAPRLGGPREAPVAAEPATPGQNAFAAAVPEIESLGGPKGVGSADASIYEKYFDAAEIRAIHPEPDSGGVYHDWQHTVKVADMAREFARSRGLPPDQVKFVSEVGLLHDIDPTRAAGMPARVPETLARLREDFAGTKSLTGEPGKSILKERFGWDARKLKMAEAMIQRTEFPFGDSHPSPAYKGTSPLARYEALLRELPPSSQAFVLREGALLSEYADKSSWYATEDFNGAHKTVEGLVDEINRSVGKPVMDVGKLGTDGFLDKIGAPESFDLDQALAHKLLGRGLELPGRAEAFALLPESYGRTFDSNLEGFRALNAAAKAGDPNPFAKGLATAETALKTVRIDPAANRAFLKNAAEQYRRASHDDPPAEWIARARVLPKAKLEKVLSNEGSSGLVFQGSLADGTPVAIKTFSEHPTMGAAMWGDRLSYFDGEVGNYRVMEAALPRGLTPKFHGEVDVSGNPSFAMEMIVGKDPDALTAREAAAMSPKAAAQVRDAIEALGRAGYGGYDSPQPMILTRDQVINGVARSKGEVAFMDAGGLTRDTRAWLTPERFASELILWREIGRRFADSRPDATVSELIGSMPREERTALRAAAEAEVAALPREPADPGRTAVDAVASVVGQAPVEGIVESILRGSGPAAPAAKPGLVEGAAVTVAERIAPDLGGAARLDKAGPPRASVSLGRVDGLIGAERAALKDWKTLDAAGRERVSEQLVDQAARTLTDAGYVVRKAPADGGYKLIIDSMPGRPGRFLRGVRALYGDRAPAFEYNPGELGDRQGSGAQFNGPKNVLEFDAASLALTDAGSLAIVKHELRHGRQARALREGEINANHGWLAFADEGPRRDLGIYDADFQIDEVLTYSKQQIDTATDLRRMLGRLQSEGTGFLSEGNNRAILESALKQADVNYYSAMNLSRALKESAETIRGTFETVRPAEVEKLDGNVAHVYKNASGGEGLVVEFMTNERLGPDGMAAVQFPAIRRGRPVLTAEGEPAIDFMAIPIPKGEMAAFERDPAAARRYIEDHLERAVRDADARRAGVLERQPAISDLVSEVRVAASAPPLARAEAAVPAAEAAGAVLPADVAGEPESPLKLPSGEKKRGLRQLEISLKERGADEVFAIAEKLYYTDPLTSLPNRASFFDKALGVVPSLERPALAMLDMNNFGAVNVGLTAELGVTKGRARADGVLTIAGASLGEIGREYGVSVSRLGGEEFVALGSLDSVQKFTAAANATFKPLRLLEESGMTQGGSERAAIDKAVADARRDPEHVADFTYGIAEIKGRSLDDALKAADEALGHGKDKIGRGAVMLETADGYVELKPAGSVKGLETLPRPQPIDTNAELERLEALLTPQERKVFNEAAFKDPLTLTRSYDYVSLKAAEWNGRYADGGMVLLSSARNLKQINDILGHEAGDVYLRKLGAIIRTELNSARRSQLNAQEPVRVASKEFMIVGRDAAEVTRRIQAKVAEKFDKGEMLPPEQVARVRAESIARKAVTEDGAALIGTLRAVSEDVRGPDGVADVQGALDRAFIALESAKEAETKAGARERPAAAPDGQPLPPIRKTMRPTDLRAGPGDGAAAPAVRPSGDESGGIGASGRRDGVWARLAERSPAVGAAESMLSALRRPVEDAVGAFNRLTGRGPPPAMANVLEFGAGDWARFSVDRVDVRERRSNARMFGDRFKAVNAELDAVRLDAAARIKDAGDKAAQKAIEAERDAAVSTKLWELTDRFGVENLKADQLTTIYNTFKDHGRFADMIKLYDRATDPDFRNAVVVRQLLAVALHKTGDLARSEQTILQRGESQRSGEDYTILAKIYKLRYEEAMKAGRTNEARVHLDRSIAALEKGFEKDYEYYPGINLVYNLMTRGAEFRDPAAITRAEEKAQLVLLAAKKAGGLHSSDFWTLTTLLESATITGQDREISAVLPKVLANANVEWMVQAPIDNLVKLRDQLKTLPSAGTPERVARIDGVIDALQHRLETLTEKVQVPTAKSRGAQLAESVLNQGHSFAEMARRLSENGWALGAITTSSVGGNIPFGGQLHSAIVNRWDFTVGRDFLGHLHLDAKTDLATFNRTVDAAIRERFGTDKDDLENLHSDGHKVFDAFTKTLLDVTAVGRGGDSRTNIMVDFLLGKGDCRHHAYVKQLLFDIWKTDKMNALMRTADAQLESGDHSGYQKILTDIGALERVRMLTFDSVVNAPIVLGPGGKYDVDLTEKGQFKTDGVARPVEDHTWNGLVEINDAGELTHLTMVDSFYQNAYRFGGGAGVPVPLDRVHLTDNGGIDISAERVQAVAEDGTVQPIDVTLTPTSYAGGTKVNPNRDDYEQVRLRGLEISPAKPDFTAKTKASIDGFITRLLADEYRRQLQFDALTKSLKDKDFALEMAAWQDGAYYRGQNQEPPPFLTPEEKAGTVTKSVADEKIAMNLAGFYADESGIGVLAERSGKSPAEIVDAMAKGELPEEDMLLIARFANATWKAGQPFRSLDRITRDTFRPAVLLTEPELMKDFDQIKAAAGKLSEKMADVRTAPRDVQLAKLKELLQSKDFALEMAAWQDGAYYRGQGQEPPPFLTPEEKAGTVTKSVADEKVAMNLAGFYAVESGLGVLAETTGKTPRELLRSIVDGTMSEKDMLLIARFANATWKAGQPFRSLDRITRDTFRPAALLTDPELAKDFDQIKAAAQKLNERVAVLEVAAYDDPTRAGALKALKASDMPAGGWRETLAHPVDAVRRLLGMRMLSDAQVDAVMRAHNEVPCNVYRCTPAQLLAKVRIMDEAGISMAVREKLIREGFAGSEDPSERETEATSRGEKDELPPLPPRVGTMKPTDTRVSSARPTQAELEARRQERVARRQTEADQLRAANDAALAQRTAAAKTDLGKLSDSARETIARSANTMKQLERVGGDFTGAHTIDQHGPSVADAALKAAVVDPPDPNNPASFLQGEKLRNTRFVSDAAMAEGVNAVERVLAKMGNANANLAVELKGIQAYNPFGKPISVNEFIHDFNAMATKTGNPEVTFDIPVPGPGSLGVGFENLGGNKIQPMTSAMRRVRVTLRMDHFRMKTIDSPIFIKTLYPVP
jgi:GGDEF domain-containing protein